VLGGLGELDRDQGLETGELGRLGENLRNLIETS